MTENLFEIEDLQLTMPNDLCQKGRSKVATHTPKKDEETEDLKRRDALRKHRDGKVHRSSVDRPLNREAERIDSYKEVSLITKIRRS